MLKVSAGVLYPGWGTTLQEECGPTGINPGTAMRELKNITYERRLKELRLFRLRGLRGDAIT